MPSFPLLLAMPSPSERAALAAFLALDASTQTKITQAIKEIDYPFPQKSIRIKARQLHEELKGLDEDTIFSIIDSITDLVGTPPGSLSDVLSETFKDTETPYSVLESSIREISSDERFNKERAIQDFKKQALPSLRPLEHFCAIRARFDKKFRYSEDNIESYDPNVVDYHAVVVVKATPEDNASKGLTFQMDEERLDRLISELIAAQRQLKILVDGWAKTRGQEIDGK
jgi:hypothetical protein